MSESPATPAETPTERDPRATRPRSRALSLPERLVLVPAGFLWLVFLALLAVPVMLYMTLLYYLSRGLARLRRGPRRPGRRRRSGSAAATVALAALALAHPLGAEVRDETDPGSPPGGPAVGFFASSREAQARSETQFLRTPQPKRARSWLEALTREPHVAGTEEGRRLAEYVRDRFREFGLRAELDTYEVLINHPKAAFLRIVKPAEADLSLREQASPAGADGPGARVFPAFHGYGASGRARGEVLYANYGRREDFDRLEAMGLTARGRVVLVRYGEIFRGLKVREAESRGAAAVIIYSDPADDGYVVEEVYPDGPARPPTAIQRGSVHYLSWGPGDPTTPGYASRPGARRVPQDRLEGLPRIPSLPISYREASRILTSLRGERVPDDWQGGLPFAYHLGPGPAEVEMAVEMDYAIRPIHNVIATIPGSIERDRLVILGNHRDAWTYGAVDPNSGTAAMLEAARGLAAALRAGWRPRRTLILASWDGEEYGLLGSTEWVEDGLVSADLDKRAVAYVNLDAAVAGTDLEVAGVPSLQDLFLEVAAGLDEPRGGGSLLAFWTARSRIEWARRAPPGSDETFEAHLDPLGSGSDYTPFLDHAGVASLHFTFRGVYGVYHSIYDDFSWMENFGDPEFLYHAAAARLYGLLAMRLASAEIVPLRYDPYGRALRRELRLLRRDAARARRVWEASAAAARLVKSGSRAAVEAGKRPALRPDFV
ncbi:MAG: M28 family metallopeptidase, partial [Acidobacteriota bacterium]